MLFSTALTRRAEASALAPSSPILLSKRSRVSAPRASQSLGNRDGARVADAAAYGVEAFQHLVALESACDTSSAPDADFGHIPPLRVHP